MKLFPISDLHIEIHLQLCTYTNMINNFGFLNTLATNEKLVICACGDIGTGTLGVNYFQRLLEYLNNPNIEVVYILGNHEFYNYSLDIIYTDMASLQDLVSPKIHILDGRYNKYCIIDDKVFIGATLWTDFNNSDDIANYVAKHMNDYKRIRSGYNFNMLTTNRVLEEHRTQRKQIFRLLEKYKGQKKVVLTHHQPYLDYNVSDTLTYGFCVDLLPAINRCDEGMLPDYWFSGHTHTSTYRPMTINSKEVIFASNQFGYYFETGKTGYSKNCIFEI